MGIGLIGMVVLKLYLYDVWLLGAFYRMAAFAILGVMLLVMSYLLAEGGPWTSPPRALTASSTTSGPSGPGGSCSAAIGSTLPKLELVGSAVRARRSARWLNRL